MAEVTEVTTDGLNLDQAALEEFERFIEFHSLSDGDPHIVVAHLICVQEPIPGS